MNTSVNPMKKAKIIFVNRFFYPDISATSRLLSDLVFSLKKLERDVYVITSRLRYDKLDTVLKKREQKDGVDIIRIWTTQFGRNTNIGRFFDFITYHLSVAIYLLFLLNKNDLVVCKTDPPLLSVTISLVSRIKKAKQINWVQDLYPEIAMVIKSNVFVNPLIRLLKSIRNKSLSTACVNVVVSERMAEKLINEQIPRDQVRVISNWSNGDKIFPIPRAKNSLREKWNISNKFVIGYSGNMGHAHDFDSILNIVEKLNDHKSIRFVFIGGGVKYPWIKSEIGRRQLTNIEIHPYQQEENIAESLSVADIHIVSLLERLEGFLYPSKFFAAAASSRPIFFIGGTESELGRLIIRENCGLVVQSNAVDKGVGALINLENDAKLCNVMGTNARKLIDTKFDKKFGIASWIEILDNIISTTT